MPTLLRPSVGRLTAAALVSLFGVFGCAEGNDEGTGGGMTSAGPTSGATTTNATSSSTGSTTTATVSTGPTTSCTPDEGLGVEETCGLFVKPSAPAGGDCSQASPCRTLADALELVTVSSFRIYVCNEDLVESAVVPAGVELYGGFDCAMGWSWDLSGRTPWTTAPDEIPLRTQGSAFPILVAGFTIEAQSATVPGGSSVAVLADQGTLRLERSALIAGNGMDGEVGADGVEGSAGANGQLGNNDNGGTGGLGGLSACATGNDGGAGAIISCNPTCSAGTALEGEPGLALGGGSAGTNGATSCTVGGLGVSGAAGAAGGHGVGIGSIADTGFTPQNGADGVDGEHGRGGGGGGAKTELMFGGGGGGAGGCGGTKGTGGGGGGSSIAIIALNAELEFHSVTAEIGSAGNGSTGGMAGGGGLGGIGATGGCEGLQCGIASAKGCMGGDGGSGGAGGNGGNGAGGHALIIAYTGIDPTVSGLMYDAPQQAQAGLAPPGASMGVATVFLEFPSM